MSQHNLSLISLIEYHSVCLSTSNRSPRTIGNYEDHLKRFSNYLSSGGAPVDIDAITLADARRFVFHLQNEVTRWQNGSHERDLGRLSPVSVMDYVRSIKAFWNWLVDEGYIEVNPMVKLKLPKAPRKVVDTFSAEQIKDMLAAIDFKHRCGYRNYAMILLMLDVGIRRQELTKLRLEDIDFKQSQIKVRGKGAKERILPLGTNVRRSLWRYVSRCRNDFNLDDRTDAVFLCTNGEAVSDCSLRQALRHLGKAAKIENVRCSPHTFRHTFAKQYLLQGGDIFSLQRLLGHSSLEMVRNYVNLSMSDVSLQHSKYSPVDTLYLAKAKQRGSSRLC
jgi:integrase/recombinase XerD